MHGAKFKFKKKKKERKKKFVVNLQRIWPCQLICCCFWCCLIAVSCSIVELLEGATDDSGTRRRPVFIWGNMHGPMSTRHWWRPRLRFHGKTLGVDEGPPAGLPGNNTRNDFFIFADRGNDSVRSRCGCTHRNKTTVNRFSVTVLRTYKKFVDFLNLISDRFFSQGQSCV